jgi:hypothetical protein
MPTYQALVIGYQHPNGYQWGNIVPGCTAPTRKAARRMLREHLSKSLTPFAIRRLWLLDTKKKKKRRGWARRIAASQPSA